MAPKDKEPPPPPPSLQEASTKLGGRTGAIHQKIEQIDKDLLKYRQEYKRNPKNSMAKSRCMHLLKQKKMYESQIMQMESQLFNMDQVQFAQENMENTIATVQAMKATSEVMKEQFKAPEMDMDMIMDMQDDMAELLEESQEINELLGQDYGVGDQLDEDELMNELDMLDDGGMDESMLHDSAPSYLNAPVDPGPPLDQPTGLDQWGLPAAPTGPAPAQPIPQGY